VTEWRWLDVFSRQLRACALNDGEVVAVLSESASREDLVSTSRIAALMLGGRVYDVVVPTPLNSSPVALRSTGASVALAGNPGVVAGLAAADLVIDCTVEGLLHAPELREILGGGARVLMISNEHPENFERYADDFTLGERVAHGVALLEAAGEMRVTSAAGTDLGVNLEGAFRAGSSGIATEPGTIAHWPGGLCLAFPAAHCAEGTVVLAPGDINLTFKTYVREPVTLRIADDHIVAIEGDGVDADLFRSYLSAFGDRESYAVSHVGFGMNRAARWDYLELYDKAQINGTEARAFAGNFLFSTGANETAGRFTAGHFDLPMRNCTVALDGRVVVDAGALQGELS
jgi:2,5-dihydroxypyridine 5,6-dioxygenase